MTASSVRRVVVFLVPFLAALAAPSRAAASPGPAAERFLPFGFRSLEIYKVEGNTTALQSADIDGDGRPDLVLADNSEGTIRFLLQRSGPAATSGEAPAEPASAASGPNELEPPGRFRKETFFTERMVSGLRAADFDSDGRVDLAYYGDPAGLDVVYQQETGWGERRQEFPVREALTSPHALAAGDLDGDDRTDLVLLGKGKTYVFLQRDAEDGGLGAGAGLAQPTVLPNAEPELSAVDLADVDGDGRLDIVGVAPSREEPVVIRRRTEHGFRPEETFRLRPLQAWFLHPFPVPPEGEHATSLFTLEASNRRLRLWRWARSPAESGLGRMRLLAPSAEGDPDDRRRLLADVDGDGRPDVLVSGADRAVLEGRLQDEDGVLSRHVTYPTLSGVNGLAAGDLDGDGRQEVVAASRREKALGVSRWQEGRLGFPRSIRWPRRDDAEAPEVLDVDVAPLAPGRRPGREEDAPGDALFLIAAAEDGLHELVVARPAGGDGETLRVLGRVTIRSGGTAPSGLRAFDADGDGLTDALVTIPYGEPFLFLRAPDRGAGQHEEEEDARGDQDGEDAEDAESEEAGEGQEDEEPGEGEDEGAGEGTEDGGLRFVEVARQPDFGLGHLGKLELTALTVAPEGIGSDDGPCLLVARGTYVRALRLDADRRLHVVDQFNGRGTSSRLEASAVVELDGQGRPEVVLVDAASNTLEILHRGDDGTWSLAGTVEIPRFDLVRLEARDLDGDGREDLVFLGKERSGVLLARDEQEGFVEFLHYLEDDHRDLGQPQDVTVGDFNADRVPDAVLHTAPRYHLLFLAAAAGGGPVPGAARAPSGGGGPEASSAGGEDGTPAWSLVRRLAFPMFEEKTYMRQTTQLGPRRFFAEDMDGDGLDDLVIRVHDRILLYFQEGVGAARKVSS